MEPIDAHRYWALSLSLSSSPGSECSDLVETFTAGTSTDANGGYGRANEIIVPAKHGGRTDQSNQSISRSGTPTTNRFMRLGVASHSFQTPCC
ncbi:hypothetical protein Bpfe_012046 [Biomphalaria pfeifferi]|uniref:Uncharacterized protein n=1 Tax=Biomphalaria pfeifferi TaxID=112525 RepID=A0AAD8BRE1_BIOPF|nr:hypothetical protein Bpfe_012046 [Biomphalaria pfeifferi]